MLVMTETWNVFGRVAENTWLPPDESIEAGEWCTTTNKTNDEAKNLPHPVHGIKQLRL